MPSSAFIHGDGDEMVEHGIFTLSTTMYDDLSGLSHHIGSESGFTTSPIYDELPQFPCEESHHHHYLSDSTICDIECTYLEGVSEPPPHRESEVVDEAYESISLSNNLTSTSLVFSSLVLGPIYDDAPIRDDYVLPLDKTMAMVEYDDATPTWFHQDEDDHHLVFPTSPTPLEWNDRGNKGDGDALVPLVDYFMNDCLHDVDPPIAMLHSSMISSCDDLPIMMSLMIAMWSLLVVMPCYIGFLVLILLVTSCLPIRLT